MVGGFHDGRVPLHEGKPEQPQKALPAFWPCRAVRLRMGLLHTGQTGAAGSGGVCWSRASFRACVMRSRMPPSLRKACSSSRICWSSK